MEAELFLLDDEEHETDDILVDKKNEVTPNKSEGEELGSTDGGASATPMETALQGSTKLLYLLKKSKQKCLELRKKWMVNETFMLLKLALPLVSVARECIQQWKFRRGLLRTRKCHLIQYSN